jgi:hypothetical protein
MIYISFFFFALAATLLVDDFRAFFSSFQVLLSEK